MFFTSWELLNLTAVPPTWPNEKYFISSLYCHLVVKFPTKSLTYLLMRNPHKRFQRLWNWSEDLLPKVNDLEMESWWETKGLGGSLSLPLWFFTSKETAKILVSFLIQTIYLKKEKPFSNWKYFSDKFDEFIKSVAFRMSCFMKLPQISCA